jgi:hypothetical protein
MKAILLGRSSRKRLNYSVLGEIRKYICWKWGGIKCIENTKFFQKGLEKALNVFT